MDTKRRKRVKEIFLAVVELSPEERAAFLTRECEDNAMRADVRKLLEASGEAEDYFDAIEDQLTTVTQTEGDLTGRRVGAYRLERFLGRGGMGTVYRADRADGQFEQRVAIKLLSIGAMNPVTHERFLAEREILAKLEHPNVGRLFDGGVSDDGTPYFVMEYIDGPPLDAYCDAEALDVAGRVRIFLQVCDAVAHAHANGVVHRDLKPANILVTGGQVKLLDFGIAKLVDGAGVQTATGQSPMTPAYASPEQLRGETVTPRTDVYALGVLLHELLTGLSPYEAEPDSGIAMLRAICVVPVRTPSTRLRKTSIPGEGSDLGAIARARQTSTAALARRLRGDLDTILLMALRKEPERRYPSVDALAADLRLHLDGFAVHARRESGLYRASRFLRRNSGVAFAAAVALLLGGTALWQGLARQGQERRIAEARDRSDALQSQLTRLYDAADPAAAAGATVASRRLLDQAVAPLRADPPEDAATHAALLFAAGRVYRRLGLPTDGRPLLAEALELRRQLFDAPDEALAEVLFELGTTTVRSGATEGGIAELEEALEMERELHEDDHVHVAQAHYALGTTFHEAGRRGGQEHFAEAVRIYRAHASGPTDEHADSLLSLADWLAATGDLKGAVDACEEGLEIYSALYGDEHPSVARALNGLGMLYYNTDRRDESFDALRESVRLYRRAYGAEGHPALAAALQNSGSVLSAEGDREGIGQVREALDMYRRLPGTSVTTLRFSANTLVVSLRRFGDVGAAIEVYEGAVADFATRDVDPLDRAANKNEFAGFLRREGRLERAVEVLMEVLDDYEAVLPADDARVTAARNAIEAALTE